MSPSRNIARATRLPLAEAARGTCHRTQPGGPERHPGMSVSITVPAGFSAPTHTAPLGIPVGMDILGKPSSEAKLLSLAYSFEQATHFGRSPESAPPLPSEKQGVE